MLASIDVQNSMTIWICKDMLELFWNNEMKFKNQ